MGEQVRPIPPHPGGGDAGGGGGRGSDLVTSIAGMDNGCGERQRRGGGKQGGG